MPFTSRLIDSIAELRRESEKWDDLAARGSAAAPTNRAELIALWMESFAARQTFRAIVVEENDTLVAALPLCSLRLGKMFTAGALPGNHWSSAGDLLLDSQANAPLVLDCLLAAAKRLPWPLLWLDGVHLQAPAWREWLAAVDRAGLSADYQPGYEIGWIPVAQDWEAYREGWSKNHRRNMTKQENKATRAGGLVTRMLTPGPADNVPELIRAGFAVEAQSWKGEQGTSVVHHPKVLDFYCRQAELLADRGQLRIAFLEHETKPIAFFYGYDGHQVHHLLKVGYDAHYSQFGPGQLLFHRVLRQFSAQQQIKGVDCLGPITRYVSTWQPECYQIGRLAVAQGPLLGKALLAAYRHIWPHVRRWREAGRLRQQEPARQQSEETIEA